MTFLFLGIFVTNLSGRNKELERSVFNDICTLFPAVLNIPIPEYVHDIVIGLTEASSATIVPSCDDIKGLSTEKRSTPFVMSKRIKSNIDNLLINCVNKEELSKELHEYLITGLIYC